MQALAKLFERTTIMDRRQQPSHGYRAVHVIVHYGGKMVEIQIRTVLQHFWAERSEKFSDVLDPAIKYGGGGENVRRILSRLSSAIAEQELRGTQGVDLQLVFQLLLKAIGSEKE